VKKISKLTWIGAALGIAAIGAGCATFSPTKEALISKPSFNVRTYDAEIDTCWTALKQIFLKNNYTISSEDVQSKRIIAVKSFDKGSLLVTLAIQANLQQTENSKIQVYLNATQTNKQVHTTRKTLFLIPIPGSTQVTSAQTEKTIDDKGFYEVFFNQIEVEIKGLIEK